MVGFFDSWGAQRQFPVDMAGFAVSLAYLSRSPNATMPYKAGYEEDEFLKSIGLRLEDIEPKASDCTEVLVWHTQTKKEKNPMLRMQLDELDESGLSLGRLMRNLGAMGVNSADANTG